jgi:hypothetical protein
MAHMDVVVDAQVIDPESAVYEIADYRAAIKHVVITVLGNMSLDRLQSDRRVVGQSLKALLVGCAADSLRTARSAPTGSSDQSGGARRPGSPQMIRLPRPRLPDQHC